MLKLLEDGLILLNSMNFPVLQADPQDKCTINHFYSVDVCDIAPQQVLKIRHADFVKKWHIVCE